MLRFVLEVPPGAAERHFLWAELALGDRPFGQIAEGLIDVVGIDGSKVVGPARLRDADEPGTRV